MENHLAYTPTHERTPDSQYKDLIVNILDNGDWYPTQPGVDALTVFGVTLDYKLSNGVPFITERDIVTPGKSGRSYVSQAIGEIIAFLNGAHTQEELESYGCYWWKHWVTEQKCSKRGLDTGDLGPGSYGSAWTNFPTLNGQGFNQIDALIAQIREKPHLRTHLLTPLIPQYIYRAENYEQKVVVVPCHGWVNIRININTNGLTMIHKQRSADVLVGLPANLIGYTALMLIIAKVTGYRPERLIFQIDDAHIYKQQLEYAHEILKSEAGILPTVNLPIRQDIRDYSFTDFVIEEYIPKGPRMIIPTPV